MGSILALLRLITGRAKQTRLDDAGQLQRLQLLALAGEILDDIERLGEFGFASRMPDGGECVIVCPSGERDLAVVIATEHRRHRLRKDALKDGDAALYSDLDDPEGAFGGAREPLHRIQLTREGNIPVTVIRARQGSKSQTITLRGDGSIALVARDGGQSATVTLGADGKLSATATDKLTLSAPHVQIAADSLVLDVPDIQASGNLHAAGNISDSDGTVHSH